MIFQSTLPTRGSDIIIYSIIKRSQNFNPRSPRGGATYGQYATAATQQISIHAPHEGERLPERLPPEKSTLFQSTLPTRGSDRTNSALCCSILLFQSTLPTRGSDPMGPTTSQIWRIFQSTLPTRGSDVVHKVLFGQPAIFQSTLPTRGSDLGSW